MGWRTMPASLSLAITPAAPVPGSTVMMRSADGCSTGRLTTERPQSMAAAAPRISTTSSSSKNFNSEKPRSPARCAMCIARLSGGADSGSVIGCCRTIHSLGCREKVFEDQQGGEFVGARPPRFAVQAALNHHLLGLVTGQALVLREDIDGEPAAQLFDEAQRTRRRVADLAIHSKRQADDDRFNFEVFDQGLQAREVTLRTRPANGLDRAGAQAKRVGNGGADALRSQVYGEHSHWQKYRKRLRRVSTIGVG